MTFKDLSRLFGITLILSTIVSCSQDHANAEGYLPIEDSKIHFKISGTGSPLMLLHGGGLDLNAWDSQISDLNDQGFKTIRYSELGHGKTKRGEFDLKGTDIINRFVDEFADGQKVTLIGLSWGGVLATDYALEYPQNVNKLILVSPGINGWDWFAYAKTKHKYEVLQQAYVDNDSAKVGELLYEYYVIGPKRDESDLEPGVRTELKQMITSNTLDHWGEPRSSLDPIPSIDRLAEINLPSLIISGDKDAEDILQIAKLYKSGIENSEQIVLPDAGHSLNVEYPKQFNDIVIDFIHQPGNVK